MSKWKNTPPVVILAGDDDFRRRRELLSAVSYADSQGWAVERLRKPSRDDLSSVLSSSFFFGMSKRTLVLIQEGEKVDVDLVLSHHKRGKNRTVLLFDVEGAVKAKSNLGKIAKALPKQFVGLFKKPPPYKAEEAAKSFIEKEAARLGIQLSGGMVQALVIQVGTDLGILSFEVAKIAKLLENRDSKTPSAKELKSCWASINELSIFPVSKALGLRNMKDLSRALGRVARTHKKAATVKVVGLLGHSACQWLQAKHAQDISKELGLHPYLVKLEILPIIRRWTDEQLRQLIGCLARTERAIRQGKTDPWAFLESSLYLLLVG